MDETIDELLNQTLNGSFKLFYTNFILLLKDRAPEQMFELENEYITGLRNSLEIAHMSGIIESVRQVQCVKHV